MSRPRRKNGEPKKGYIDSAKFVTTWVNCDSILEVSNRLNLSYANCRIRYNMMVNYGVKLPHLTSGKKSAGRAKLNVDALNRMIKEIKSTKVV